MRRALPVLLAVLAGCGGTAEPAPVGDGGAALLKGPDHDAPEPPRLAPGGQAAPLGERAAPLAAGGARGAGGPPA